MGVDELRVSVWKRYGQDRLYVNTLKGEAAAWQDRRTGEVHIVIEALGEAARAALAAYETQAPEPAPSAPALLAPQPIAQTPPPIPPDFDLALHKPGDSLRGLAAERPSFVARIFAWLMRRPVKTDSWNLGIAGEQVIGAELNRLTRRGWYVLHSVPLPRIKADIDHLLIGPGGVFTVNAKNHRGRRIWVGDHAVRVDHGKAHPYLRTARREAARAARVLTSACGFPITVTGILAFVSPAELRVVPTLLDVRAFKDRDLSSLAPLSGVLTAAQAQQVFQVARDRRLWESA
ncbi:nuclease-related domain-containing protein [Streptomyces sp. NPDC087270]|uniref:nuclease-related domain-containing protein n=1 Tax=Streptomyces sp. NPDC087270 TaxID=3365774 RepID=UPI0037FE5011